MSSNKIMLKSSDGETFEIEKAVARKLQIIAHMIEDDCVDEDKAIPLQNVTGKILTLIIMYCNKHVDDVAADSTEAQVVDEVAIDSIKKAADAEEPSEEEEDKKKLDEWDAEFMKNIDFDETMFELVLAANYLNVKGLLDLACQKIADNIKDKKPEEIRKIFNIENDYTPEEEEEVRKENAWAFE